MTIVGADLRVSPAKCSDLGEEHEHYHEPTRRCARRAPVATHSVVSDIKPVRDTFGACHAQLHRTLPGTGPGFTSSGYSPMNYEPCTMHLAPSTINYQPRTTQ